MNSIFVSDAEVARTVTMQDAISAMHAVFLDLGQGHSTLQDRVRVTADGVTLSMMGGIYGAGEVMGAKVYPTVRGQFDFVINLFSNTSGKLLRVVQGNQLTRLRTAAVTRVVADACVCTGPKRLAIFGSGVQAQAHVEAFCLGGDIFEVLVCARHDGEVFATDIRQRYGVPTRTVEASAAAAQADIVVTATRSPVPLFDGTLLRPGAFVAAIGSSKPSTREIDDATLERASRVVVESAGQAMREGGDLVMAANQAVLASKLVELGALISGKAGQAAAGDITVYKSVGIGIEDVALAMSVHAKLPL
jgi:ornithine cyclodeaminase